MANKIMKKLEKESPGGNRGDLTASDKETLAHWGDVCNQGQGFDLKKIQVSVFVGVTGRTPVDRSLDSVLADIQTGIYEQQISKLRAYLPNQKDKYDAEKKRLRAFTVSGTAKNRKEPGEHSNLLQVDLDKLGDGLPALRERLKLDPHVAFGFVSPGGHGLKLGVRIDGTRHDESFRAAAEFFRAKYEVKIDPACKDRLHLCFVSHDPDLWINTRVVPLPIAVEGASNTNLSASCILHTYIPASLQPCISASLHNSQKEKVEMLKARREAMARLVLERPGLAKFYQRVVEPRFEAIEGGRNNFIVNAVPFLYPAVVENFVLLLVGHFYDCNRPMFNDSREQHMKEAEAHLRAVDTNYPNSLIQQEREFYEVCDKLQRAVFRICLDLALLPEKAREPLTFYLSFDHLGDRLGIYPMQAQRLMRHLLKFQVIGQLEKGTRRQVGQPGKAGTYKWLLREAETNLPKQ
jgi:VirE N-terminal domain